MTNPFIEQNANLLISADTLEAPIKEPGKKLPWFYISLLTIIVICWAFYMFNTNSFYLYGKHFYSLITMIIGAFVAGSSPEGSAAVAYPVFYAFS